VDAIAQSQRCHGCSGDRGSGGAFLVSRRPFASVLRWRQVENRGVERREPAGTKWRSRKSIAICLPRNLPRKSGSGTARPRAWRLSAPEGVREALRSPRHTAQSTFPRQGRRKLQLVLYSGNPIATAVLCRKSWQLETVRSILREERAWRALLFSKTERLLAIEVFESVLQGCFGCDDHAARFRHQLSIRIQPSDSDGGSDGFVSSTAAPIASGWSEPSSRAGLSPAADQRLFTAHV
jgi:hypothetical protein